MSRLESWFVHLSTLLVGATGLIYAVMRYLMEPVDPFSVVNHSWQPAVQHLHILVAPFIVFGVGLVWRRHISSHWQTGLQTGKRSGISMVMTMAPMVVSGYLIQVTITDQWRTIWIVVHCFTSGLWITGYVIHQAVTLMRKPIQQAQQPIQPLKHRHPTTSITRLEGL